MPQDFHRGDSRGKCGPAYIDREEQLVTSGMARREQIPQLTDDGVDGGFVE